MNKLEGFYELAACGLPAVPWQEYRPHTELDPAQLWTVRTAVLRGSDLDLPRAVGVTAEKAQAFAAAQLSRTPPPLVLYYPFFCALKSGTLEVAPHRTVIEAVDKDLWNLVTHGHRNVTLVFPQQGPPQSHGDADFLSPAQVQQLQAAARRVRSRYRGALAAGQSVLLEWSYGAPSDLQRRATGDFSLVFLEIRTL